MDSSRAADPQPCLSPPRDSILQTPTPEVREAILLLSSQNVDDVFAYSRFLRFIDRDCQRHTGGRGQGECLSDQEVEAIRTLSGCTDHQLRAWLGITRDLEVNPEASHGSSPFGPSLAASSRCLAVPGLSSNSKSPSTKCSHLQQTASLTKERFIYRCTSCDEHQPCQTVEAWRKREKEHEFTYICAPDGWVEKTESGNECVVCAVGDPDVQHASEHNAHACQFTSKRRVELVKHLRNCHGISDTSQGQTLADKWKRSVGRHFWSCGFCGKLFFTLPERLKHIDSQHFQLHQLMDEWNPTNIINGLLKQPGVLKAWQDQLMAYHGGETPDITWAASDLKDLQLRLERGPSDAHSAESLAKAAYEAATIRCGDHGWTDPTNPTSVFEASGPALFRQVHQYLPAQAPITSTTADTVEGQHDCTDGISRQGHGHSNLPTFSELAYFDDIVTQCPQSSHLGVSDWAPTPDPSLTLDLPELTDGHLDLGFDGPAVSLHFSETGDLGFDDMSGL